VEKRFIALSWHLLEAKYIYYRKPEYKGLSDTEYDLLEFEYKELAAKLGRSPTVSTMVDFDDTRASCQLVMEKLDNTKKIGVLE